MKKFLLTLAILLIGAASFAQGPWDYFFKPTPNDLLTSKADSSAWFFKPTLQVTAMKLTPTGDNRVFDVSSLTSAGAGVKWAHYIQSNGKPYNNFSVSGLVLFGVDPGNTTSATISMALTVEAFEVVNVGGGYDFFLKKPIILLGINLLDIVD